MSQLDGGSEGQPTHPRPDLRAGVGAAGQRERLGRAVDVVCAGGVLDPAEVPLGPHADAVVRVRQLQSRGVVVVEGEHPARHPSEVLQAPVRSYGSDFSLPDILARTNGSFICDESNWRKEGLLFSHCCPNSWLSQ